MAILKIILLWCNVGIFVICEERFFLIDYYDILEHPQNILYIGYSVKRGDVTRWKQCYITPPLPYFILWNAATSLGENKVI